MAMVKMSKLLQWTTILPLHPYNICYIHSALIRELTVKNFSKGDRLNFGITKCPLLDMRSFLPTIRNIWLRLLRKELSIFSILLQKSGPIERWGNHAFKDYMASIFVSYKYFIVTGKDKRCSQLTSLWMSELPDGVKMLIVTYLCVMVKHYHSRNKAIYHHYHCTRFQDIIRLSCTRVITFMETNP